MHMHGLLCTCVCYNCYVLHVTPQTTATATATATRTYSTLRLAALHGSSQKNQHKLGPSITNITGWFLLSPLLHSSILLISKPNENTLQIIAMQSLHYLTLSFLIPPLLSYLAEPESLAYEGGASNVGVCVLQPLFYDANSCVLTIITTPDTHTRRYGHGLAGNGWPAHRSRHPRRRVVE